jgi:hypothetical protein
MHHDDNYFDDHNFTVRFDSNNGKTSLEMNFSELYLNDILTQFRDFLRGCGYEMNGELELVPWYSEEDGPMERTVFEPKTRFDFSNIPDNNWLFGQKRIDEINPLKASEK